MSAGAQSGSSVRTTLINILCNTANSVKEMKDLGSQIADVTKAYLSLKYVLGNMIRAYDEIDAIVRRSSDIYARNNIVMVHAIDTYGELSTGLAGAVSVFQQLIQTQGMTEESMVRLAVQARELSYTMNRSIDDIAKSMRTLKVNLGLTNTELEHMIGLMGVLHAKFGTASESMESFASIGGTTARIFGGTAENAMYLATAFERATGSAQNANALFGKFMRNVQTLGMEFAGLDSRIDKASKMMLKDPVRALGLLSEAMADTNSNTERYMLTLGILNPVEIQWVKNLTKQKEVVEAAIEANKRFINGTETLGDVYNRVIGGVSTQMKQLVENIKELGRGFAAYLAPAFALVLSVLNKVLDAINSLPKPIKGLIGLIGGLALAWMSLGKILGAVLSFAPKVIGFFGAQATTGALAGLSIKGLAAAAWAAVPAFASLLVTIAPWVIAIGAAAVVVAGLIKALGGMDKVIGKLKVYWKSFSDGFASGFADALKPLDRAITAFMTLFNIFEKGNTQISGFSSTMHTIGKYVGMYFKGLIEQISSFIFYVSLALAVVQDLVITVTDERNWKRMGEIFEDIFGKKFLGHIKKAAELLEGVYKKTSDIVKTIYDYSPTGMALNALNNIYGESTPVDNTAKLKIEENKTLAESINQVADATERLTDKETTFGVVVAEKRSVSVEPTGQSIGQAARQAILASTMPYPENTSTVQVIKEEQQSQYNSGIVQPINIILDDYIVGQALIPILNRNGILSYGDSTGPRHGIR